MIEAHRHHSSAIAAEFVRARRKAGSPAMGMVMTLVVVVAEDKVTEAMESAQQASFEHPARVLGVILGSGRGAAMINAQVGTGDGWTGEVALIRLSGPVVQHPESVVLPLLLPDSPVVVWWAGTPPKDPGSDPLGQLAQRRITDVAAATRGRSAALLHQCREYAPGSTDLAWTRLTPWRALLAAALDVHQEKVQSASVTAERISPSADLLDAWLASRLRVPVSRHTSSGPGITKVELETKSGPIKILRTDGRLATLSSPGQPDRPVALKRRTVAECLAEELRRLDEDDTYAATARKLIRMQEMTEPANAKVEVHPDADALATAAAGELLSRLAGIQAAGEVPVIALTGGTIADSLHREIARLTARSEVDWSRVEIWWGDERYAEATSAERNAAKARADLLDQVPVDAARVHEMPDTSFGDIEAAAAAYSDELRAHGTGEFDIVMLGVGPDGHIASLFPGLPQLDVDDRIAVAVTGSPKPPPERISLTLGALNRARSVWFLVSGQAKADAVASALGGADVHQTPAAGVIGNEETIWFVDHEAASKL